MVPKTLADVLTTSKNLLRWARQFDEFETSRCDVAPGCVPMIWLQSFLCTLEEVNPARITEVPNTQAPANPNAAQMPPKSRPNAAQMIFAEFC